jgi:hypothetical protein
MQSSLPLFKLECHPPSLSVFLRLKSGGMPLWFDYTVPQQLFFMVVRSSIREELSINSISCPTCGVSAKNRNMSDTVMSGRREDENGPLSFESKYCW